MVKPKIGKEKTFEEGMDNYSTPYQAIKTAPLEVQFALDPSFGLTKKKYAWFSNDTLFDDTFLTEANGSIDIETSATSGDTARLRSAYPGQYISHTVAEPGVGFLIPEKHVERDENNHTSLTHGEISVEAVEWDETSNSGINALGMSFESDATYIQVRRGDSDIDKTPQNDWNIDPLDGTGPSGRVLRPENGYVYNFPFTWYNQGAIVFVIYDAEIDEYIPFHRTHIDGDVTVGTPNMPVQVTVENKTTADPLGCRVGGMQFSTYGGGEKNRTTRITEETRVSAGGYIDLTVSTTRNSIDPFSEPGRPLVSIRRDQSNIDSRTALAVEINDLFINVDQDVWVFVFDEYNPESALTGQNFTTPVPVGNEGESFLDSDTEATAYTPSTQSTLRSVQYVQTGSKEVRNISGDGNSKLPIGATIVTTAALATGSNATEADPFIINMQEGY